MNGPQPEGHMASYIERRKFLATLGGAAAWPLAASAQQLDRVRQISVLMGVSASDSDARPRIAAFEQTLQDLGRISSRNIRIDYRWPAEEVEQLQKLAKDVVASGSEIVVGTGTAWVAAVLRETSTTAFCVERSPVNFRSKGQPGSSWPSISRLPRRSALKSRQYCSRPPTR
jgi:ABC-type uncharacterized transport system substrate-binding protein